MHDMQAFAAPFIERMVSVQLKGYGVTNIFVKDFIGDYKLTIVFDDGQVLYRIVDCVGQHEVLKAHEIFEKNIGDMLLEHKAL